jgi:uncharacterized membrane protein
VKRPGRWDLLDHDSDPLDADLYAVGRQRDHYTNAAELISEQTARLRSIGSGDNDLVGKYAATLKDKSGELADDLYKTHGRYEAVGSALKTYYPALDDALTESWAALQDAIAANSAAQSANSLPKATATDGKPLTDDQTTQNSRRDGAIQAAGDDLGRAKTRLANALSSLNDVAKKVESQIKDAADDDLKDGFWDKFMSFLVEFVKIVVDIAGWIAIACAIVMLFVPGLNILATIALAATIASLVGHTFLAATGNGSWLDVAIDIVALATFGMGKFAGKGLQATEEATAEAGTRAAARGQRAFNQELSGIERRIATGTGKARMEAIAERAALGSRPIRAAQVTKELQLARESVGVRDALEFGGDKELAESLASIRRARVLLPNSGGVANASAAASHYANLGRAGWSTGLVVTGADKGVGHSDVIPGYNGNEGYNQFKEGFTHQVVPWPWGGGGE